MKFWSNFAIESNEDDTEEHYSKCYWLTSPEYWNMFYYLSWRSYLVTHTHRVPNPDWFLRQFLATGIPFVFRSDLSLIEFSLSSSTFHLWCRSHPTTTSRHRLLPIRLRYVRNFTQAWALREVALIQLDAPRVPVARLQKVPHDFHIFWNSVWIYIKRLASVTVPRIL